MLYLPVGANICTPFTQWAIRLEYHVNFFGSKPQRNWMKASHIKDFSMTPPATPKAKKNKDLQKSIEQANEAQKLSVKERLKKYSFAVRYEGHWAKVKEFDKVDLPPNCLKRRKEKSADFRSQVIAEEPHGSRDCKRTKTARMERNVKSKSATKRKSADNEEFQPSLNRKEKIEENNHSRNQFAVLGKANEEFQPSLSHEEKIEKNNHSRNQFAVLGKANEEFQPSLSRKEKIEENNRSRNQFAVLGKANEEFQPSLSHEEKIEKNNHSGNQSAVLGKANEEFQPSLSHKEKIEEKNLSGNQFAVLGKAGAKEKPESSGKCVQQLVQAKTHEDGLREEHHNTEDEKNKESSEEEDSSVHSDTTISSDEDENMASPDLKAYSEFLRKIYPPIVYDAKKVSLSGNDTGNYSSNGSSYLANTGNYSANGSSDLAIHNEHSATFSENVSVINQEGAAEFSEKNPVINHGNIAEYSQNDSGAYILDTDPSLLRTPYTSCYTPKNEQFSNRRERFKKNRELTDKLINSNNSKYMPYSFYRGRMKK
ncbi:hypothetical protein AVEN_249339-1 [Araneus ventricosus]|uniref:Uncharacterized protein n=1 Tax=Araneus ventricosus TaxID=182803 RepID=A0A4Y2K334_ARAVE|nr:hypothetical protein AVEN_249339-1 [Araneus ventricosus]